MRGIEDHGMRHGEAVPHRLLEFGRHVGDAGARRKFAAGDRGRHADLAHAGRVHRRRRALDRADRIHALDGADVVGEAKLHRLGAVGDRAAADGHDQVGIGIARLLGCRDHGLARRVLRHRVEDRGAAAAQRALDLLDLVGLASERARHHQEGAGLLQPVHLGHDRFRSRLAEHDLIHRAEYDTPSVHALVLPGRFRCIFGTD